MGTWSWIFDEQVVVAYFISVIVTILRKPTESLTQDIQQYGYLANQVQSVTW
jgi:hypothetical protein